MPDNVRIVGDFHIAAARIDAARQTFLAVWSYELQYLDPVDCAMEIDATHEAMRQIAMLKGRIDAP